VKWHSWIIFLGQQGTEAATGRLGVLRLTCFLDNSTWWRTRPWASRGAQERRQQEPLSQPWGPKRPQSHSADPVRRVAMEEHLGATLSQQGVEPWLSLCVVSDFHDHLRPRAWCHWQCTLPTSPCLAGEHGYRVVVGLGEELRSLLATRSSPERITTLQSQVHSRPAPLRRDPEPFRWPR
jgi:hypothetical protein